ncbi:MAG: pantoate--beta-alanine ligase [Gammaproteobacteria bacterium]|nr:pantoate--beta-alanine ligase [Gammaproteobacteria bacterium]
MQIVETVSALKAQIKAWRRADHTIAVVPTMGNLHQGHLSLVAKAKEYADKVVVSIFVNPLQFDDKSDLSAYPRTIQHDIEQLTTIDCDLVFTPSADVMYPEGMDNQTTVSVPGSDDKLCGKNRVGHFDGVATVVTKLFNMVQADFAVFGEKDYQQLLVIKKLVQDLNIPIDIVGVATYREDNGLAMSSRNQYLTQQQHQQAAGLYQTLVSIEQKLQQGDDNFEQIQSVALSELTRLGFEPDYVDIRQADTLAQATSGDKALRILAAARLGKARLIDNIACNLA